MPLYEYECTDCGHLTEALQRLGDPPLSECPRCGGPLKKLLSAPAFQFKGSGWYVTDYARKGQSDAEAKSKPPAGESGKDGDKKSSGDGAAAKSDKKSKKAAGSSSD